MAEVVALAMTTSHLLRAASSSAAASSFLASSSVRASLVRICCSPSRASCTRRKTSVKGHGIAVRAMELEAPRVGRLLLARGSVLNNDVGAGAAVEDVDARAAKQRVVTVVAVQGVEAEAADQDVVVIAAVGGQQGDRLERRRLDDIVPVESVDDDTVGGVEARDDHLSRQAGDGGRS